MFAARLGDFVLMPSYPHGRVYKGRKNRGEERKMGAALWSLLVPYSGSTFPPETRVSFTDPGAGSGSNIDCTSISGRGRARA